MKKILFLSLLFLGSAAFGQMAKLKKANDYFDNLAYAYAAPLYEELLGSEVETPSMKANLGRSYYFMGDMVNAEKYLSLIMNSAVAKNDDLFFYAQALKQNGKIEMSDEWMNKFRNRAANDIRGESFSKNTNYLQKIIDKGMMFEIKNLDINTSRSDFGGYPGASGDAYFVSNRKERAFVKNIWTWNKSPYLDLYKTKVTSNRDMTDVKMLKRKVNSKWHEGPLCFSSDGRIVYFTRNNVASGKNRRDTEGHQNLKLYRADINTNGSWTNEQEIHFNSKDYSVGHPTITADGKTMYFASDMPGGFGGADIYRVDVKADGTLGSPTNLGKNVNTEGQEMFPWVNADGTLFIASNGHIGLGGLDVFAIFPNGDSYDKIINVGLPVNSEHDDFAFTMNNDGSTGYFSSNRVDGGKGDDDIYSYSLLKPIKPNLVLQGLITDNRTKLILPNAEVILVDNEGNMLETTTADQNGFYSFNIEPDMEYQVMAAKEKYFDNKATFSTENLGDVTLIQKDLPLEQDPGLGLYALVTDGKTKEPLQGVRLKITDKITGRTFIETLTPNTGDALKTIVDQKVGEFINYDITLQKEGYFPKTVNFKTKIDKVGIIPVHQILQGGLTLDPLVTDLKDLVQINDIRFDLNKADIRPDAAKELDKIIEVMNKYPEMEVELGSHTDCRASYAYNEKLSDRRAKASAAYIKARISNPDRIYGKGYGESKLLNGCACEGNVKSDCSEEEHEKNRRTEFKVIKSGSDVEIQNNSTNSFGN